jgi:hypothetical protein
MPVVTFIADLIKKTVAALEADHAPKTLEEVGIQVPDLMWVSIQLCAKNPTFINGSPIHGQAEPYAQCPTAYFESTQHRFALCSGNI